MDYGRYGLNGGALGGFIREASDPNSDVSRLREARAERDFEEFCEQNSHARRMREENARLRAERDWLLSWFDAHPCCMDLQCPFGRTLEQCEARDGGMLDSTECWQEAARRAVAGEERK